MIAKNALTTALPYPVERALKKLGGNLRTARLRRNLTIRDVADKIGTGPRPVSNAERGKPSTGIAVYVALLWVYGQMEALDVIADPALDKEGLALAPRRERARARQAERLDNDF